MRNKHLSTAVALPSQRFELRNGYLLIYANSRAAEAGGADTLLAHELDEVNHWARLGAQLYFGWFTLIIIINGAGIGWLFMRNGGLPPFAPMLFWGFIVLNLLATIATYKIWGYMLASGRRVTEVLESLTVRNGGVNVQSAVPEAAINAAFFFTGATLFMLLLFWAILTGWGMATNFSRLVAG
jgi:hypothetical protein